MPASKASGRSHSPHEDVIRHELVARIVAAYDRAGARTIRQARGVETRDQRMTGLPDAALRAAPLIDVVVDSRLWRAIPDAETVLRRAVAAAAAGTSKSGAELAILLTDDSTIRGAQPQMARTR